MYSMSVFEFVENVQLIIPSTRFDQVHHAARTRVRTGACAPRWAATATSVTAPGLDTAERTAQLVSLIHILGGGGGFYI